MTGYNCTIHLRELRYLLELSSSWLDSQTLYEQLPSLLKTALKFPNFQKHPFKYCEGLLEENKSQAVCSCLWNKSGSMELCVLFHEFSYLIFPLLVDAYVVLGKLIDLILHQRKSYLSMEKYFSVSLWVYVVSVTKMWE